MTVSLPAGWGPTTVLIVLYALVAGVAGGVKWINGDIGYEEFVQTMQWPAVALGGLSIGRGVAYGGQGTGFGSAEKPDADVRR